MQEILLFMQKLKKLFLREHILILIFCLAVIQGPAFSLMDNYNTTENPDCITYIHLAKFDFNENPIRRYRLIVPLIAGGLNTTMGPAFKKMEPMTFPSDFPLSLSFFIINSIITCLSGVLLFRYCKTYHISQFGCIIGILTFLTCRWTSYYAGLPLVDSLYFLICMLTLVAIKEQNTTYTLLAIFLGPFVKEPFIFVAPLIFVFSHLPKLRLAVYFILSGIAVFSFRYLYDLHLGVPASGSIAADAEHLNALWVNFRNIFTFHGVYDILSNIGFWIFIPLLALFFVPAYPVFLRKKFEPYIIWYLISVFAQMIISGALERMFYLAMPVMALYISFSFDELYKQYSNAKNKFI